MRSRSTPQRRTLALILRKLGAGLAAVVIGAAAIIGCHRDPGFPVRAERIFFRDGAGRPVPSSLAKVNARTGTPVRITLVTAALVRVLAGLVPLAQIAALANAGTCLLHRVRFACWCCAARSQQSRRFGTRAWRSAAALGACICASGTVPPARDECRGHQRDADRRAVRH